MNRHIHHVPGRLRVQLPDIRKSGANAEIVRTLLLNMAGVSGAEPNLVTGSIVIRYEPKATSAASILHALIDGGHLGFDPPVLTTPRARPLVFDKIAAALFWYCVEKAVERSIPLLLATLL